MRMFNITVNGVSYEVGVEEAGAAPAAAPVAKAAPAPAPKAAPAPAPKAAPAPAPAAAKGSGAANEITSPLPGTVLKIVASEGQAVKSGDIIMILEAMKMENEIVAPADGTISAIKVSVGASVQTGDLLATM